MMPFLSAINIPLMCVLRCAIWHTSPPFSFCQDFFFWHNSRYWLIKIRKNVAGNLNYMTWMGPRLSSLRSIVVYWLAVYRPVLRLWNQIAWFCISVPPLGNCLSSASYLTSLNISFLFCKIRLIQLNNQFKMLSSVPGGYKIL